MEKKMEEARKRTATRSRQMPTSLLENAVDLSDVPEEKYGDFIGRGYRAACYKIDARKVGMAVLFGFDTEGNRQTFVFPHQSWVKYRSAGGDELDIYGSPVKTIFFKNTKERAKWMKGAEGIKIVEALSPEQEILQKLFRGCVFDSDFNSQQLRVFCLDIETEISDGFMSPEEAGNRINMITIHDSMDDVFHTWSLENNAEVSFAEEPLDKMGRDRFDLRTFHGNEVTMLDNFMTFWEQNYPDVVCGWNSQAYDMPYIVRRIQNVFNNGTPERLSPVMGFSIRKVNHENERSNAEAEIEVDIDGIFQADDLRLYRDKFGVKGSLDGGYSLDNVGEAEGLGHKIHYNGTLKDLYLNNYQKFYEYNVRDVDLLSRIEKKCKLIPLARKVCGSGLCNYDAIYTSISYLIGSLIAYSKTNMGQVFQSYMAEKKESKTYEGAYVFPPTPGVYRGGIATVDFNSLYPSSIRNLNLSPETYVGKVVPIGVPNPDDPIDLNTTEVTEFMLTRIDNDQPPKKISIDELRELVRTKCVFSRNNCLLLKHSVKQGVISSWCRHFFTMRKSTKKEMQGLEMKLYNKEIKDPAEIERTNEKIENLNSLQLSIKLMINSIYGILGSSFSPIGNVDLAQSITRHGKFLNISASEFARKWMQEKFQIPDSYISTISGDTDSCGSTTTVVIRNAKDGYCRLQIGRLFDKLVEDGLAVHPISGGYEVLDLSGMGYEIMSSGGFRTLELISRHRTVKRMAGIRTESGKHISVTVDHVCMRYNRDHFLENVKATDLVVGDLMKVHTGMKEELERVVQVEDEGETGEYVYDCKVEGTACFYGNGILVHNSQFLNITCVVDFFSKKFNLPSQMKDWSDEWKLKLWKFVEKFVEGVLNPYVQNLTVESCYSEHPEVLRYSLEYIGDAGIYEQKKRYAVHKVVSEGPELVDKLKYTGIELKRSNVPPAIKEFLKDIYEGVLLHQWGNGEYESYLKEAFSKFSNMPVNDIAFWKGWTSDKIAADGFLKSGKGMTIISRAAKYHNDMIEHLGLGKKYESLKLGNKIRLVYIEPSNSYGIDVMGFSDGNWPKEFDQIFSVDYAKMFDKLVLDPLRSFRSASKFLDFSPANAVVNDIFAL